MNNQSTSKRLSPQARAELADRVMNIFIKQYHKRLLMQMSKAFRRWAYEFPLNVRCAELTRQLKERNSVLETVRGCYLKDVISLKHQLEKLHKLADSASSVTKAQIEDSIYELHTLPSIDLRNVIEKAETCFKQSSVQLQNNLIEAGIMDPITGKTYNPWDQSRAYRRMKRLETGGSFNYPTSMGESYPLAAPRQYQLIVHYCSQCVGFISFVKKWNEEVEESIQFRTEYYAVDTKIEDFKRVIKNLQATIEEKENENIGLISRINELENANQWFEKWTQAKNTAELQSFFRLREEQHKQQIAMLLADKDSTLKELSDRCEARIAAFHANELRFRQKLQDKDDELQKETEWRYQLNKQIDNLTDEKENLQHTIRELHKEQLNQKEEYDSLQSKHSSLEKLKNDLLKSINQYELDLNKQRQDTQIKMQQYQQMLKQLEAQIQSLENTNSTLVQELRERKQLASKSENELIQMQNELTALQELLKKYQYKCPKLKRAVLAVMCILRLFRHLKRKSYSQLSAIGYRVASYQQTKQAFRMNDEYRELNDKYETLQGQFHNLYERNLQYKNEYSEFDFLRMQLESTIDRLKEELSDSQAQCKDLEEDYNILKQQFQHLHGVYLQEKETLKNVHYIADLESVYTRIKIFGHIQRNLSVQCLRSMFRVSGMINVLDIPIHMKNLSLEKKLLIQDDPELYQYFQDQEKNDRVRDVHAKKINDRLDKEKETKRKNAQFKKGPRKNKKLSPEKRMQLEKKISGRGVESPSGSVESRNSDKKPAKSSDAKTDTVINSTKVAGKDFAGIFRNRGNRLINSFHVMKELYPVYLNMKPIYDYWIHWIRHGRTFFADNSTDVESSNAIVSSDGALQNSIAPEEEVPTAEESAIVVASPKVKEEKKVEFEETGEEKKNDSGSTESNNAETAVDEVAKKEEPPSEPKLPPPPNDALLQDQCNRDAEAVEKLSKVLIKDVKMVTDYIQELRETIYIYTRRMSRFSQLQQDYEKLQQQYQWAQMQLNRSSMDANRRQQILKLRSSTAHMLNQDASSYLVTMLQAIDQVKDDYGTMYQPSSANSRSSSVDIANGPPSNSSRNSLFSPTMVGSASQNEKRSTGSILLTNPRPTNSSTPTHQNSPTPASALSGNTNTFLNMPLISTKMGTSTKTIPTIHAIDEGDDMTHSSGGSRHDPDIHAKSIETVDANPIKPSAMSFNASSSSCFESTFSEGSEMLPLNDSSAKENSDQPVSGNASVSELEEELGDNNDETMIVGGELDSKSIFSSSSPANSSKKKVTRSSSKSTSASVQSNSSKSSKKQRSKNIIVPDSSKEVPSRSSKVVPPAPQQPANDPNSISNLLARYSLMGNDNNTAFQRSVGGGGATMLSIDTNLMNSAKAGPQINLHDTIPEGEEMLDELEVAQQEALLLLKRDLELKETINNYQAKCDDYVRKIQSLYDQIDEWKADSRQQGLREEGLREDLRKLTDAYEGIQKENQLLRDIIHDDYRYHSGEVQKALLDIQSHYQLREEAYFLSLQKQMKTVGTQIACSVCAIREYGFTPKDILLTHDYDEKERVLYPRILSNNSNAPTNSTVKPVLKVPGIALPTVLEEPSIIAVPHDGMAQAFGDDVVLIARPYHSVAHDQSRGRTKTRSPSPPSPKQLPAIGTGPEEFMHLHELEAGVVAVGESFISNDEQNSVVSNTSLPFVEKVMIAVNRNHAEHLQQQQLQQQQGHNRERSKSPKLIGKNSGGGTTPKQRPATANAIVKAAKSMNRPPSASAGQRILSASGPGIAGGTTRATNGAETPRKGSGIPTIPVASNAATQQEQSQHMIHFAMSLLQNGKPPTQATANKKQARPHSAMASTHSQSVPLLSTSTTGPFVPTTTQTTTHLTHGHHYTPQAHPLSSNTGSTYSHRNSIGGGGGSDMSNSQKGPDEVKPTYVTSTTVKLTTKNLPPNARVTVENNGGMFYSESPFLSSAEIQHALASKFRKIKQIPLNATFAGVTSVAATTSAEKKQRPVSATGVIHREATEQRTISNTAAYLQQNYHLDKQQQQPYQPNALYRDPIDNKQREEPTTARRPWSASRPLSASFRGGKGRFTDEDENIYEDISGYIDANEEDEYI